MRQVTFLVLSLLFSSTTTTVNGAPVTSPDGQVSVSIEVQEGELYYRVELGGAQLVASSPLGILTSTGDFTRELAMVDESSMESVREKYALRNGKQSQVDYHANRKTYTVKNADDQQLSVVVQVSDDGVALAYQLHGRGDQQIVVESEATGFSFVAAAKSYLHPMHVARSGWMRTNPSYEAHYHIDRPVGEPSPDGQGWCFPALFEVPDVGWALVSETGVDGGYCGSHLAHDSTGGVYHVAYPQPGENMPDDPSSPTVAGDARLPWRLIIVGESLAPVVESTLATDLVSAKYELSPLPTLGKAVWSWVFLKDGNTVFDVQKEFIDMAADLGLEYILIDSMWDQQIGREKLAELVDYAAKKNVGVLLWYNSNGQWNDAPQTPRNRMHEAEVRQQEMSWLQEIGVKGVKVDFFGGDKQAGMEFYDQLLRDAADHNLSVNFHGTTLPRGWERMYPNYVTNEAVMGMEFCTFEQINADRQPQHCTVLPFVRNVVGPMDFTPVILSERLEPNDRGPHRRTTDAFELALVALFQSGVQHLGVTPDQMAAQPQVVRDYLRAVPTTWDETRLVAGEPGKYVALGRRSGDIWYLAAINGEDQPLPLDLALTFAKPGAWRMIYDGENGVDSKTVTPTDEHLRLTLPANGGAVLWTTNP